MDKETVSMVLENIMDLNEAAKYMNLSKAQFCVLLENHKITPIKDHFYYKGDLDDYMHRCYSLNSKNVKEALLYYTMQTFCNDNEKETLHLLHTLEIEKQFDLHDPFFKNLEIICSYLHIQEASFYKKYAQMEAYFMNLPSGTLIISKEDGLYPIMLKDEKDAPYFLFVLGDLKLLDSFTIGIVGSEHPREDEIKKALYLCDYCINKEMIVVSGLERGINTYLALEIMKRKSKGIFVLSCSFLDFFPKENKQLYEYMIENGLVISQFIYHSYQSSMIESRNLTLTALSNSCILLGGKDHHELTDFGYEALRQNKLLLLPSSLKKSYMHFPLELNEGGGKYFSNMVEFKKLLHCT